MNSPENGEKAKKPKNKGLLRSLGRQATRHHHERITVDVRTFDTTIEGQRYQVHSELVPSGESKSLSNIISEDLDSTTIVSHPHPRDDWKTIHYYMENRPVMTPDGSLASEIVGYSVVENRDVNVTYFEVSDQLDVDMLLQNPHHMSKIPLSKGSYITHLIHSEQSGSRTTPQVTSPEDIGLDTQIKGILTAVKQRQARQRQF